MPFLAIIVDIFGHEFTSNCASKKTISAELFKLWLQVKVKLPKHQIKTSLKQHLCIFLMLIDKKSQKTFDFKPVFGYFRRNLPKIPNFQEIFNEINN